MARGNQPSLAFGRLIAILVPPSEDAIALPHQPPASMRISGARVDDLPKTQVLTTFLAGKVVYQIASPLDFSRDAGVP
jgi:hypothetical protein